MYNNHSFFYQYKNIMPPWPLMYVMQHFPYVYKYPDMIYKPYGKYIYDNISKKHHKTKKGSKYASGIAETLEYIQCYSPSVLDFLLKCDMPYKEARKIVKKMINSII